MAIKINADDIKGRAKVAAGAVMGDKDLENEGRIDRFAGQAKDHLESAADKAQDLLNSGFSSASGLVDKARVQVTGLIDKVKK